MKLGILCSNCYNIDEKTRKGTEIFVNFFIHHLHKNAEKELDITVFASGNSSLPTKIESIDTNPSSADPEIMVNDKHVIFELALISKAFSMQNDFDLYHVHIGDGDIIVPFAPFVTKPVIITLHHIYDAEYTRKYFSLFQKYKNIFFVSISNAQRKILPNVQYAATIYHGIDIDTFPFNPDGGNSIMWAGRITPLKGIDTVINVAPVLKKQMKLFGIQKKETKDFFDSIIARISDTIVQPWVSLELDRERASLVSEYASSKLFFYPVNQEEAFGLVLVEAMACGTPVVAYARGSIPEIIVDGETGFIVNASDDDIRGNWIIKKTGTAGLIEAVERIYAMPKEQYQRMRQSSRERTEKYFSVNQMITEYQRLYKTLT